MELHLIYSLHGHTGADISAWLQQPGCQLRQANTTTNIQLPVRWHQQPQTEQSPEADCVNSTVRTFTIYPLSGEKPLLLWCDEFLSATSMWPTHSCIEKCAKPGGFVCYIFLSELVYAHTEACTYIHKGCVGRDGNAVTGVPHLLSCERVPELALG